MRHQYIVKEIGRLFAKLLFQHVVIFGGVVGTVSVCPCVCVRVCACVRACVRAHPEV